MQIICMHTFAIYNNSTHIQCNALDLHFQCDEWIRKVRTQASKWGGGWMGSKHQIKWTAHKNMFYRINDTFSKWQCDSREYVIQPRDWICVTGSCWRSKSSVPLIFTWDLRDHSTVHHVRTSNTPRADADQKSSPWDQIIHNILLYGKNHHLVMCMEAHFCYKRKTKTCSGES